MSVLLFTGFPGFLGVELLPRLLRRQPDLTAACLVQPRYINYAKKMAARIESKDEALAGRIKLYEGDITLEGLGLPEGKLNWLKGQIVQAWHLAALYDLAAQREPAQRVNVQGTRNVLAVLERASKLERLHYVSTCYVSGRHDGLFREEDLQVGQRFNNHYEATKYAAEVELRRAMAKGMPATIYRPSIVTGDSRTGATQKYDGPYHVLQWLLRLPAIFPFPHLIGSGQARVNIVPRDFVVDAMEHLSGLDVSAGRCYQLADPRPLKVPRLVRVLGEATSRKLIPLPLPESVAKLALRHIKPLRRWMRIPPQSLSYFTHPTRYSVENTLRDLKGSGVACPSLTTYVDQLVEFMRAHGEISDRPMV